MEDHNNTERVDISSIEWFLSEKGAPGNDFRPDYGDLSLLNSDGLILKAVGKHQLLHIASEYLDLLETSSAIYELNGDYALGIFSSGWCRLMDSASRKLCGTDDNQKALESGKWHCHESCWKDASLKAMLEGIPVDIVCNGGIHLYAVPVKADGKIVGAINFGYGNPPSDEKSLQELSIKYGISIDALKTESAAYRPRPEFIIEYAKNRIRKAAAYLGLLIEHWIAEEALRESETRFRELFQNIRSCVAIYQAVDNGADFEFLDFNKAGERVEQITKEKVIGRRVTQVFPGVIEFGLLDVLQRVWRSGIPESHPVSLYHDGSITGWRENFVFKLPKDEIVSIYDDITEQKQAEEKLKNSQIMLSRTERIAHIGSWEWDMETDQVFWSEELFRIFQLDPNMKAPSFSEHHKLYDPEDFQKLKTAVEMALLKGIPYEIELKAIRNDGSARICFARGFRKEESERGPIRLFGTLEDITDRKKNEEELFRLKNQLELEVKEKTAELQSRVQELERYHDATVKREFRIKELRDEIAGLKSSRS